MGNDSSLTQWRIYKDEGWKISTFAFRAENANEITKAKHNSSLTQWRTHNDGWKISTFALRTENTEEFIKRKDEKHLLFD